MHPRTRLVYFYFLRVNFLIKASTSGRCDQVWLPWQRYICRSRYGCFCSSPQVTYLHTKIEGGLKFFISNFASLSWRIALKRPIEVNTNSSVNSVIQDISPFGILANFVRVQEIEKIKKNRAVIFVDRNTFIHSL